MKRKLLLAITLMLTSLTMMGKEVYCSPDGTGSGTQSDPCSFTSGLNQISSAGDILWCKGGIYYINSNVSINKSGTKEQNICIFAVEGEEPIFDFRGTAYGTRGFTVSTQAQYLHIKGLTLRYAGKNAILMQGSYCTLERLNVYGNGDTGVQLKSGHSNLVLNCDSYDNFDYQLGGVGNADFGGNADGFADKQYSGGGGNTYRGCRAWNNSDDGWDFYQHVTGSYGPTIMENCICYNQGPATYDMRNHPRYNTDKAWFDQFAGSGMEITTKKGTKVICTLEKYFDNGNGNGFKLGGDYTAHNVNLDHCLALWNASSGFDQNNNNGTMLVYNCTSLSNGKTGNPIYNYGFTTSGNGDVTAVNCVSLDGLEGFSCGKYTTYSNTWDTPELACTEADFESTDRNYALAPREADGSLPVTPLMYLKEGSKLIDAGVNVGLPFKGNGPDIGWKEFGTGPDVYPPSLKCTTDNLNQSVRVGKSISDIIITWDNCDGVNIHALLPQGVVMSKNKEQRTVTLSGTPMETGTFTIEVSTNGGSGTPMALLVTLIIKSSDAYTIGYVTIPGSDADEKVLETLNADEHFSVVIFDASKNDNDYSDCDMLLISSVPGSNAAAMSGLKAYPLPTVLLKPWMMKSGVWSWGTAANTQDLSVKVAGANHVIFNGLAISDDQLKLFNNCSSNAVTGISAFNNCSGYTTLATATSNNNTVTIAELTDANMNGDQITKPYIMIGLSEYSMAAITADCQKLILNSCYYVLDIPTAIKEVKSQESRVKNASDTYYSLDGRRLSGKPAQGLYIHNGKVER
jgi:hypothetical protein